MLKSLELSGFKSFAKKTELQFKSQVTAIVGPNGSGKSNVAEAFRFVLGEQSMKSMRGKRGEDLIWNGSTEASRSNRAKVKLVFDNLVDNKTGSKNIFNLDFDEVIIERVVNRDGGNEYYLNGSLVRLKDIIELLSEAHIGASGHHIISQGEADRILTSNIKERKEIIEDALGLKIYQYKREESQRKLLKTEENIKQVLSLRREIAPHIRFLKKQVEKVEKAAELKMKLNKFYREYLKREKIYLENQKSQLKEEEKPLFEKLEELDKEMEEAKQILNTSSKKDEKSEELLDIENKIKEKREVKDELFRGIGRIEGELNANQRNIEKIKIEESKEESKTIPLKEVEELEKEVNNFSEAAKIIEKIRSFIAKHRNKSDNKNLDELIEINKNLKENKEEAEEKIKNIDTSLNELSLKYNTLKNLIEKEKDSSREAEKNIFKISSEQSEFRAKKEFLKEKEHRLNIEENDWKREIEEGGVLLGTAILGFENEILNDEEENSQKRSSSESPRVALTGSTRFYSHNFFASFNEPARKSYEESLAERSLEPYGSGRSEETRGLSEEDLSRWRLAVEPREKQEERRRELEKMKIRLEELGGGGEEVLKEYKEIFERDEYLSKEIEDLENSAKSLEILIKELLEKLDIEFKEGIDKINKFFYQFFSLMFGGGEARLEVVKEKTRLRHNKDDLDNIEEENGNSILALGEEKYSDIKEGIDILVSLPRKKIKGLEMLSGGERALTSIALLFAISQVNPPPFIILDETDAALDEANSKKYGDMIESLSKVSQLILITHNRETMSRANIIYGVTMDQNSVSNLLSIAFDEAVAVAK